MAERQYLKYRYFSSALTAVYRFSKILRILVITYCN